MWLVTLWPLATLVLESSINSWQGVTSSICSLWSSCETGGPGLEAYVPSPLPPTRHYGAQPQGLLALFTGSFLSLQGASHSRYHLQLISDSTTLHVLKCLKGSCSVCGCFCCSQSHLLQSEGRPSLQHPGFPWSLFRYLNLVHVTIDLRPKSQKLAPKNKCLVSP